MAPITEILIQRISNKRKEISAFFAQRFSESPPLFYNSVDLRHNGIKIAPVDTNCFPAGFNNLCNHSKEEAKKITSYFLSTNFPDAKRILIIPENHTRNLRYLKNIYELEKILSDEREVKIGTLIPELKEKTDIDLENGELITLHPLIKQNQKIATIDNFEADLVILNNDLTNQPPEILQNLKTPVIPSIKMGWYLRTKSNHFDIYNQLAIEIAKILEIDPWLISSMHKSCNNINFKQSDKSLGGLESLAENVDELIEKLREKYTQFKIKDEPYCYVKADNGTYGIAVWPVFSGQDVLEINKKKRNKMNMLKGSVQTQKVMIQEGIKTIDRINGKFAEPMIYMIDGKIIGNLFRTNESRNEKISLNSPGANFFDLKSLDEGQIQLGLQKNKITEIYALLAKLAALSSSIENYTTI